MNEERDKGQDIDQDERRDGIPEYIGKRPVTSSHGPPWGAYAIAAGFTVLLILSITWCTG